MFLACLDIQTTTTLLHVSASESMRFVTDNWMVSSCHFCNGGRILRPDYICLFWSSLLPCRRCRLPRTNKATTSENLNCRDFSIHNGVPARNMRLQLQSETGKPTFCIQAPKLTIGTRSPPAFFFQTTQQHSITHTTIFDNLEHREDRESPSIS